MALSAVLSHAAGEPVLSWSETETLAALDIDFHGTEYAHRPGDDELRNIVINIEPRPSLFWRTHGRGLRLIYVAADPFTAPELAALGGLAVLDARGDARVEIKSETRHPGYPLANGRIAGPVTESVPSINSSILATRSPAANVETATVNAWLEANELERGGRYPHEKCPIAPGSHADRDPVIVRDTGIQCFACAALGRRRGSRAAGWVPFARLMGGRAFSQLPGLVHNFTHWGHAESVIADNYGMEGDVARLAYSAALKLTHGDDPRIAAVFAAGSGFMRFESDWTNVHGETLTKGVEEIVASFPAFHQADGKVDRVKVARALNAHDLTDLGYPPITPVWGCRVASVFLDRDDETSVTRVMPSPMLRREPYSDFRPKYVPATKRGSEQEAWDMLELPFSGLNRALIRLLIAAKGCAESPAGMPPLIFIDGPSGGGKTVSAAIAAAICGDSAHSVPWYNDSARMRQGVMEAKSHCSFVVFNEMLKDGKGAGKGAVQTMDFLLTLTPESLSHKLYIGPVKMGRLPVMVWTDTDVPHDVKTDAQLARRLTYAHLTCRNEWEHSIQEMLGSVERLRIAGRSWADACDVILSSVVDDFFTYKLRFTEIAKALGFGMLSDSSGAGEGNEALQAFFAEVCETGDPTGVDRKRWGGAGWKVFDVSTEAPLSDMWRGFGHNNAERARHCNSVDWRRILSVAEPTSFEHRTHGKKVAVRFRSGEKVNQEVKA